MRIKIVATLLLAMAVESPAVAQIIDYSVFAWSLPRGFNFNGDRPFVNPITGQADIATFQFDGKQINGASITNNGSGVNDVHIQRVHDNAINEDVTRVVLRQRTEDAVTAGSHRTQINSYAIEPYKRYILDLEFKLDDDDHWDFSTTAQGVGPGLIWQLKGQPKIDHQWGNPVMGLNLSGNQLKMEILYPLSAAKATAWPMTDGVSWAKNQYVAVDLPQKTLTAGVYHRVQLVFYADDAPNKVINQPGIPEGKGFVTAYLDGQPWFNYVGPTLHPDQLGPHNTSFGWYQWSGAPTTDRVIYYRKNSLYEWK
ncbi:heparin lyase I family protein [Oxalobacteraceae bacterium]|nr:heparin lyase I family protein [Oxalobacteraceae bacterium]